MNKEKFLKELEKKLSILNEEERNDIIDEYKDIIDEKVKHGKTEEEAVKDFGNLNGLAKEIISTYKVDPNYNKNDTLANVEKAISSGAKKLTEITEDIVDNVKGKEGTVKLERLFELIIKIFILLLVFALLRIPFYLVSEIGQNIMGSTEFLGFGILGGLWKIFTHIMYYVVCVLLLVTLIKSYQKEESNSAKKENSPNKKKASTKSENQKEEIKKDQKIKEEPRNGNSAGEVISTLILLMIKLGICILFLFPLWMINITLAISIGIIVYLIIKGVALYGLLILVIGCLGFGAYLSKIIFDGLFHNKKVHLYPFIISFVFIVMGGLFTFDYFSQFTIYNCLPEKYETKTNRYVQMISEKTYVTNVDEYKIDNTLKDNQVVLEAIYYPEAIKLGKVSLDHNCGYNNRCIMLEYEDLETISFNEIFEERFLKMMKEKKVYDYSRIDDVHLTVYTNEKTKDLVIR